MIIGVDAHILSGKHQGSRTYLSNLYREVLLQDSSNRYMFCGHWNNSKPLGDSVSYIDYPSNSRFSRLTFQTAPLVKRFGISLFHSNYIAPLYLPCKSLLTIHDVLYETHSQYFSYSEVFRNKLLVRLSAKRATQIHTVSEYSRQAIIDLYHIPPELVWVVPNGVDRTVFYPGNRVASAEIVSKKFGIRNYILTVGRLEPRKNHIGLLRAYALLKREKSDIGPLVIVGNKDFGYKPFFDALHELDISNSVHIFEGVDEVLLPHMYRAAKMFVYPSFAEGFGIPPIEAMACGTPVISSDTTALADVISQGGVLVNPANIEDIAAAMFMLETDTNKVSDLVAKGYARAEQWSWSNSARQYLDAVEQI